MKIFEKIKGINNPFVIGTGSFTGVEVADLIPQEGLKLVCQVVIAVATLIKFFKERKKAKNENTSKG